MQEKIIKVISDALMGEIVNIESTVDSLTSWDSLGHLSILSALDEVFNGKITEIQEFSDVKSVKEIVELCEKYNLTFSDLK